MKLTDDDFVGFTIFLAMVLGGFSLGLLYSLVEAMR